MAELKPCPFCGGKGHVSEEIKEESGAIMRGHVVWCGGCNCSTELFTEQYDAITAWNTRHTPDEITAALSRLERENGCEYCNAEVMDGNPIFHYHADHYIGNGKFSKAGTAAHHCPMCGKRLEEHHEVD